MLKDVLKFFGNSLLILLSVFFIGSIVHFGFFELSEVNGRSMEDTFNDRDIIVIDKVTLLAKEPQRGQVVSAFGEFEGLLVVKRIIGLPGETVIIRRGEVLIRDTEGNEFVLDEPYLTKQADTFPELGNEFFYPIADDEYFLMGDSREHSTDSRNYGAVTRDNVVGIVRSISFLND
ncbi:MAG: signal peptidase I [Candidatus Uhrbacteria bacterium]|nr:signal peptidase I [Candidatus Uhrbacteria bacterium]